MLMLNAVCLEQIRARRFEQDIRLQRVAIGLEAKEEEEKQLRHAMHHLLDLEKEKLREEHRVTSSVLKQIQKDHQEREQAMENLYEPIRDVLFVRVSFSLVLCVRLELQLREPDPARA